MIRMTRQFVAASTDGTRTIEGLAVPYGVVAEASTGPVMFLEGSLPVDGPAPKLIRDHDVTQPIGLVVDRRDTTAGMEFSAKISSTVAGDEALTLALDGVLDSVSVGVNPTEWETIDGTVVVAKGEWLELSLVPFGAFSTAKVTKVAATPDTEDPTPDPEPTPEPSEEEPTMSEVESTIPTAPLVTASPRRSRPVTAGEFIAATLSGKITPRIQAIVAEEEVADIPGLVPELLIGNVFDTLTDVRPLVTALGTFAMPGGGETFNRRKVTQHTTVAIQDAEYDELASSTYNVSKVPVTKKWIGGTLNLSEQAIAYSDQSLVDLVIRDMARGYAGITEEYACTELLGGAAVATATISDFTDGDEVIEDLYAAAAEILDNFGEMPTHLAVSPSVWSQLGAAKDSGGNRIFPYLGPSNAAGTAAGVTSVTMNPLGLSLVVSTKFTGDQAIIFNASAIECYEERRGALRVENPSTLSTTLAFRGVFAVADIDLDNGALSLITPA